MNAVSFGLIAAGVLLNTFAQLLLKAGTNSIGHFEFALRERVRHRPQVRRQPVHPGRHGLLRGEPGGLADGAVAGRGERRLPMLSVGFAINAVLAWWLLGEPVTLQRIAGIAVIIIGVTIVARS